MANPMPWNTQTLDAHCSLELNLRCWVQNNNNKKKKKKKEEKKKNQI